MADYIFLCTTDNRNFVQLDITNPPLSISFNLDGIPVTIKLWLFGGPALTLEAHSEQPIEDVGRLADVIIHTLSGLYDSIGLSTGRALSVRLEGYSLVGTRTFAQFNMGLPSFADAINAAGLTPHDWISLSIASPHLRAALRDVRLAMQTPGEAAAHCFRAIERTRQSFSIEEGDRRRTWDTLQRSLNVDRSWLDTYTQHATAVRHGELVELPLLERNRCFEQAATVIIRYAAYLKNGRQKLSEVLFPILIVHFINA